MNGSSASIAEAMTLGYTARAVSDIGHDNQDRIDRQKRPRGCFRRLLAESSSVRSNHCSAAVMAGELLSEIT